MALTPGAKLGAYEIDVQIGVGGMGEVYRATDTKLKRHVAIKVLPEALAADAERLARLQREAEVLAQLNHPNIAAIYGLEEQSDTTALVMELVEGPTLADRITTGSGLKAQGSGLPLDEALPIARQIAEALEAAHQHGIVHRDLKPANIKIRPDGTVKVLDFGLAKALGPDAASTAAGSASLSPTITTPAMTQAGVILGTAAYMSPEQARGKPVDRQSDIWAFGCVLYEMFSGRRAYEGEDVSDTLAAVLRGEPDWNALPATTPPAILRLLHRCLRRDPRQRLKDMGDVRLDLEELASAPTPEASGTSAPKRWRTALPWALAAIATAVGAYLLTRPPQNDPGTSRVTRLELTMPQGVELYRTNAPLGLSPDGSRAAFIGVIGGVRSLYIRQLDQFEAVLVRGTETASWCCAFSPDERSVLFMPADATLKRVSLTDRLVTTVATSAEFFGADWVSNDRVVFLRSGQLWQASLSGGTETQLTMDDSGATLLRWPRILPGGEAVLVAAGNGSEDSWRIDVLHLSSGERHTVLERGTLPIYVPTGHLLFYRDGELLAAPFDLQSRRIAGATVRVVEDLPPSGTEIPVLDVSGSGVLAYAPTTSVSRLVWVSRQGAEQVLSDTPRGYANPRLDPDGRWVLVQAGAMWIHDIARSTFRLLSDTVDRTGFAVLTPDGSKVVFRTPAGLRWQMTDGSGGDQPIGGTTNLDYPATISANGEQLLFVRLSPTTSGDIYMVSLTGDSDVQPVLVTNAYEGSAKLSPDGRWLVYSSNDSGRMEVYLRPFPAPDRRWQVSTDGGTQPIWNPNGGEIFYRSLNRMIAVGVSIAGDEPVLSDPVQLFDQPYAYGSGITIPNYDISADGQRFVMVREESGAGRLNLVINWFNELRRLAPID